jgi:hypothetical protein
MSPPHRYSEVNTEVVPQNKTMNNAKDENVSEPAPLTWLTQRYMLFKNSCPFYRTRMECFFRTENVLFPSVNIFTSDTFVLSIRAIGPRSHDRDEHKSELALKDALASRGVLNPEYFYRVISDIEWPNHWLIHVTSEESKGLPAYNSESKGVFWNTEGV